MNNFEKIKQMNIDEELSCNNCLEKTRCNEQQQAKEQRINAILSYITNDENAEYIKELKNEIPALTRCDVVLEKQLKRLEQENKELRQVRKDLPDIQSPYVVLYRQIKEENEKLKEEIKLIEKNNDMYADLFYDDYFKGLTPEQVIGLAKKSIRITAYNRELENALEEIREINKEFFDMNYGFDEQGISEDVKEVAREIQEKINEVLK